MEFVVLKDIDINALRAINPKVTLRRSSDGSDVYWAPDAVMSEFKPLEKAGFIKILTKPTLNNRIINTSGELIPYIERIEKLKSKKPGNSEYIIKFTNGAIELSLSELRSKKKFADALYDAFGCELAIKPDDFTELLMWIANNTVVVDEFTETEENMLASILLQELRASCTFVKTREEFGKYTHAVMLDTVVVSSVPKRAVFVKSEFIQETLKRKNIEMKLTKVAKELRHMLVRHSTQIRAGAAKPSTWFFKPECFGIEEKEEDL